MQHSILNAVVIHHKVSIIIDRILIFRPIIINNNNNDAVVTAVLPGRPMGGKILTT